MKQGFPWRRSYSYFPSFCGLSHAVEQVDEPHYFCQLLGVLWDDFSSFWELTIGSVFLREDRAALASAMWLILEWNRSCRGHFREPIWLMANKEGEECMPLCESTLIGLEGKIDRHLINTGRGWYKIYTQTIFQEVDVKKLWCENALLLNLWNIYFKIRSYGYKELTKFRKKFILISACLNWTESMSWFSEVI